MRNLLTFAVGLSLLAVTACTDAPGIAPEPPVLKVTSPARSTVQGSAGKITVTGQATPNAEGNALKSVVVNGVTATLSPDGNFSAQVEVQPGATLIHTVATDDRGTEASDTRSIEAGQLKMPGQNVTNALAVALSTEAFGKLSDTGSTMLKAFDFNAMLAPMQPMFNKGGSCLGAKVYVDSMTLSDAHVALTPVDGGLSFSVELDGVDLKGHADYKVACIGGSNSFRVQATAVIVSGTLDIAPNGMMGFTTNLVSPYVDLQGLNISASGLPGDILNLIDLNGVISFVVEKGAEMFMGPMINKALGGLAGPQKLNVMGKTIDIQVAPTDIQLTSAGGKIALDMMMAIEGLENTKYVFTPNGTPNMDAGQGMQLGLADDLANDLLTQVTALGLINISMPTTGGTFDNVVMAAGGSAPMISGSAADGKMQLILPDMKVTFQQGATPVASAALNAAVDLAVAPSNNGYTVAIQLGKPQIFIDVTQDIPNETRFADGDLSKAVSLAMDSQIASISALLGAVPLPSMGGLQMRNMSMGGDSGYVMVKGDLQ